jgi:hypothetical protein
MSEAKVASGVNYPVSYIPLLRICKCGVRHRVDCADPGIGSTSHLFQHCEQDHGVDLIGPLLGAFEDRDGLWIRIA